MLNKTFNELYEAEKARPSHAQEFINKCAELTYCAPFTIRMWLSGNQNPTPLAKAVLAEYFETTPEALFPPTENEKENENGK